MSSNVDQLAEFLRQNVIGLHGKVEAKPTPSVAKSESPKLGRLHYRFPELLACAKAGVDAIALVGPAGTGKTTAAIQVAARLGRSFEAVSFGPTTTKSDLFGFVDAHGVYHDTGLVRAAKSGGVFLGDEFDAGNAGVATGMNMVLANQLFSTPVGMVPKHADFVCVLGMNTYGQGANRQYVGRLQQDAAALDRQVVIDWGYDPGLEAEMIGISGVRSPSIDEGSKPVEWLKYVSLLANNPKSGTQAAGWIGYVWLVRDAIERLDVRHIVSPRATLNGVRLLKAGLPMSRVKDMALFKGMDRDTRTRVESALAI